jgi:hypothetical protein
MAESRGAAAPIWMPVFAVPDATEAPPQVAAHPSPPGSLRAEAETAPRRDAPGPRIGTALRHADGSYRIQLTALPLNGMLILRPPGPEDGLHPGFGGKDR